MREARDFGGSLVCGQLARRSTWPLSLTLSYFAEEAQKKALRDKKRGGQKSTKKYKRRRKNIIDRDYVARKAKIEAQEKKRSVPIAHAALCSCACSARRLISTRPHLLSRKKKEQMEKNADPSASSALDRF